jgi:YD repeat-containing protein
LGYQSYTTTPALNQSSTSFTVKANWKAYPVQVQYNLDNTSWETVTSNLQNQTAQNPVPITSGSHTLYFSESSSKQTKFSWYLYVPVDNTPDTYTATMQYDTYGNVTSVTDAESNTISLTYSSTYSYAYLTEISATVGTDTITTKATYDSARGWITSIQEPEGVDAGSGYDYLFSYDLLGRITKKEFPLLSGQSQRSYLEAIYDDTNRTVTIIDQLRHYITRHYDKLGRLTDVKAYTGTYGSGTLYATVSYTNQYNNLVSTVTDPGNDTYTYTYDFLGRETQIQYPDSSAVSYSYDDTNNKVTYTNGRNYDRIYWYDWLSRLEKVEEEYTTDTYAVTTYQYDDVGHLASFTDAETHTTTYTYASLFGLTKTTYPDSEYEEYTYDNMGNVTVYTDCKGNDTTFTYDDIYRLTQIQYADQSTVDFTYDLNSNRTHMDDDAPHANDYVEYTFHEKPLRSEGPGGLYGLF